MAIDLSLNDLTWEGKIMFQENLAIWEVVAKNGPIKKIFCDLQGIH